MKNYRKMLMEIGAYENGMIGIPASTVIKMNEELEKFRIVITNLNELECSCGAAYENGTTGFNVIIETGECPNCCVANDLDS